ncbi:EAL domain-containing protein [Vibrio sp. ABG19]|uniref:EAL domain-containing protein n=1 Tax=Vibrio sp. ABG19 TaxID=2817385 RepID=UPI00249E3B7A|nr:EAL domain-containing protein [Vibrio sp. ABG19]WGY45081.1 EAL domain-containing protein [Vibrio sp. ABG19]
MISPSDAPLKQYLSYCEDGHYIAHYRHITLQSVFQPIVTRHNLVIGVEALLRIYLPDGSALRPDLFFHSERVSLADKLNIEYLSRMLHLHNFAISSHRSGKLFLNTLPLSGSSIQQQQHHKDLTHKVKGLGLSPSQIVMEFIEVDSDNEQRLQTTAQWLSNLGYQIAIDDFGCNASTAERVELLNPDIIKLDRQLLVDYMAGIQSPLLSAVQTARNHHAIVIAEGIETEQQFQAMTALALCGYQGYYLGLPEAINQRIALAVGQ